MHYALDKLERRQGKYTSSAQFLLYEEKVYFERKEVFFLTYIYIACLLKHWIYGYIYIISFCLSEIGDKQEIDILLEPYLYSLS